MIKTWPKAHGGNAEMPLDLRTFPKYHFVSLGDQLEVGEEMKSQR